MWVLNLFGLQKILLTFCKSAAWKLDRKLFGNADKGFLLSPVKPDL